jgi:hypothetical protein
MSENSAECLKMGRNPQLLSHHSTQHMKDSCEHSTSGKSDFRPHESHFTIHQHHWSCMSHLFTSGCKCKKPNFQCARLFTPLVPEWNVQCDVRQFKWGPLDKLTTGHWLHPPFYNMGITLCDWYAWHLVPKCCTHSKTSPCSWIILKYDTSK